MNFGVIGTGFVGLVTAASFAEVGNKVICVDTDSDRIKMLKNCKIPIYETGLEKYVQRNLEKRLFFSTDIKDMINKSSVIFIALRPPENSDDSTKDLLRLVAHEIGKSINDYKVIVNKTIYEIGATEFLHSEIKEKLDERNEQIEFDVVANPEFLREGSAVEDFMRPDRIILGIDNVRTGEMMKMIYEPFNRANDRAIKMDIRSAEMTKYATNSMLAARISFMNEIARLCENFGADVSQVRKGIGSDSRIGYKFIYPGLGYGGSCFPHDIKALIDAGKDNNLSLDLLNAVEVVNEKQKLLIPEKIKQYFGKDLSGLTFAIWGLSFKPETDDMSFAPSVTIIEELLSAKADVQVYDPVAMKESMRIFGKHPKIHYEKSGYDACKQADALLLVTEWLEFRHPDFDVIKENLKNPIIFDGRNQYNPKLMKEKGFTYFSIGRA